MRSLLLSLALMLLVPTPALSLTSQGGPSGAQYDQYHFSGSGVGGRAAHDAIVASDAIRATPEEAQATGGNAAAAAEAPEESTSTVHPPEEAQATGGNATSAAGAPEESTNTVHLEELPETGGPSPLWLGVPLLCAGGFLARRVLF